jgi:hypothetical protein
MSLSRLNCTYYCLAVPKRPFSVDVGEAFRIKDGKILKVEALMTALPYGAKSPFVPQE